MAEQSSGLFPPNALGFEMKALAKNFLRRMLASERFNKLAVRLYSVARPPPYQRPNMEFDFDVWNGICTFRSVDGRQLGENNVNPVDYKILIPTEHRISAFEGSRRGLPINITALRQVMSVWDDTLQLATLLRNDYIRRRGLSGTRLNLRQGYVLSKFAAAVPAYLVRRRQNSIDALPNLEAAFWTVGVGPFMVTRSLMERGDPVALHEAPLSGAELYEMADKTGTLITPAGYACAGSKKLIVDFLDVMMNGTYQKPLVSADARRAIDSVGDWDRFYAYIEASSRLELVVKAAQYLSARWLWALRSDSSVLSELESQQLDRCLARTDHFPLGEDDERLATGQFIVIALALLDELDGSHVRAALAKADLLQSGRMRHQPEFAVGDARAWAARQIRLTFQVLFPICEREIHLTHRALQRFESSSISLDDFYTRCCGPEIAILLRSLEASPVERPTAVESFN
ncbi:hypothetical protein BH09PSE5_BH09PSE5_30960 [soil metagenome]